MNRARAYTFTLFCNDVELENCRDELMAHCKFVVFQKERAPTTLREHYQGYLFLEGHNGLSRNTLFARIPCLKGAHLEPARGTPGDNVAYCTKEETRIEGPWTFGDIPAVGRPKVKHSLEDAVALLEECSYDLDVLARTSTVIFGKFHRQLEAIASRCQPKPQVSIDQLRPWQQYVKDLVASDPDSRSVNWFVDPVGGQGKTLMAKYLVQHYDAFYCTGGKHQDILHAYNNQRVIIFDFTRDKADLVAYSVIEMLKNGIFFSGKYNSTTKTRPTDAHVIVFSNFEPDTSKLSQDRWRIKHLSGDQEDQFVQDPVVHALLGV